MSRGTCTGWLAIATLPILLLGCQTTQPRPNAMTIDDVVTLAETGASSITVGNAARVNGLTFPMSVDNIVLLKERGLTNPHVDELLLAEADLAADRAALQAAETATRPQVSIGLGFGYWGGNRYRW